MVNDALTGEALFDDPYPVYAQLRKENPVARFDVTNEYLVTRWADCQTVGANDTVFGPSDSDQRPEARVFGMSRKTETSRTPASMMRPTMPLAAAEVASRSPK